MVAQHSAPDPSNYDLTSDFNYAKTSWGSLFYLILGNERLNRLEAKNACEKNNASLPVPFTSDENDFYTDLGSKQIQTAKKGYFDVF